MLDLDVEYLKKLLTREDDFYLSAENWATVLGERAFQFLKGNGFLQRMNGKELDHSQVTITFEGVTADYTVYWESPYLVLDPIEDCIESKKVLEDDIQVFKRSLKLSLAALAERNGFSACFKNLGKEFIFVGSKLVGKRNINFVLWLGDEIPSETKLKSLSWEKSAEDFFIVCMFKADVIPERNYNNFVFSPLRKNLLIDPAVVQLFNADLKFDYDRSKFPVFIDLGQNFLYLFGKKVNLQANTKLYNFMKNFILSCSESPVSYSDFCANFCTDSPQEPSIVINERRKELRAAFDRIFPTPCFEKSFLEEKIMSFGEGFLKCEVHKNDVFMV